MNLWLLYQIVQNVIQNIRMRMAFFSYVQNVLMSGAKEAEAENNDGAKVVKDANGNVLQDGDAVTVIKDLKVKGTSSVVKIGTKVKSIRLVDGDHDIDCKIDGFGAMKLKSQFVKKA